MMEAAVKIDGQDVRFRVSAAMPRLYRHKFGRDLMQDMAKLQADYMKVAKGAGESLSIPSLEIFENLAYIMAWYADPTMPDSPEEWLEGFGVFSIYEVFPHIMELLNITQERSTRPRETVQGNAKNGPAVRGTVQLQKDAYTCNVIRQDGRAGAWPSSA